MSIDMNLDGMDRISSRLEKMGKEGVKIGNKGLEQGANAIITEAKNILNSNGSVRTGKLKKGLKISKVKKKGNKKYIQAGIQRDDNSEIFYGKFLEFGTSRMSARPFLVPAYYSKKEEAKKIIINELKKGLGI